MTDKKHWKDEIMASHAEHQRKEFERWSKENPDKFYICVIPAADEPKTFTPEGQAALQEIITALQDTSAEIVPLCMAMDAVDGGGGLTGEIFAYLKDLGELAAVLLAWKKLRGGRRLRLKYRDIEIEGDSIEAMKQIVDLANKVRTQEDKNAGNEQEK